MAVDEILPGLLHWTAFHERIRQPVSSYLAEEAAALIDPMLPEGGVESLNGYERPRRILLSNRHHLRHSAQFVKAFGCSVHCVATGLHEFGGDDPAVEGFGFGDEPAPGVRALEMGAICPDDTVLHIEVGGGALALADGLIHTGGELSFVPDALMGDDPSEVKGGLVRSLRRLLEEEDFDHLLFAHGDPVIGGGRAALERFVNRAGGARSV